LQFAPRKLGNSVFIDADFNPYPDQWQFLSTIRRMAGDAAEEIVAEAQRKGDLIGVRMSIADDEGTQDPWTLPPSRKRRERPVEVPLPKTVQITRANGLRGKEGPATSHAESVAPAGGVSEPGVLQGAGDSAPHLQ
jgi:hypothetical protein